jgi:NRDE-2, necessary for RNA interference
MDDAGYHEASIALWQAVIEFLVFRPQSMDHSEALTSFEAYWDSEVPRVGEGDWVTWAAYHETSNAPLPQPVTIQSKPLEMSGAHSVEQFVHTELLLQEDLQFPGRTIDDAAEDDPFHVVLFSDLEPILSTLLIVPNTQILVLMGFLCYSRLPPLQTGHFEDSYKWWLDPFLKHHGCDSRNDETDTSETSFPASWSYCKVTTGDLFSNAMDVDLGIRKTWVSSVLKVFVQRFPDHDRLCEYYIAFKLKHFGPS